MAKRGFIQCRFTFSFFGQHRFGSLPNRSSGTPIFSICLVYTTYIPGIRRPHQYRRNIRGIFMYIPWISNVVHIHGISMDIPRISTKYIRGISMHIHGISFDVYTYIYMVYLLTYIHGRYVVYPWIFLAFFFYISRPVRAAGLIQCAHMCW